MSGVLLKIGVRRTRADQMHRRRLDPSEIASVSEPNQVSCGSARHEVTTVSVEVPGKAAPLRCPHGDYAVPARIACSRTFSGEGDRACSRRRGLVLASCRAANWPLPLAER